MMMGGSEELAGHRGEVNRVTNLESSKPQKARANSPFPNPIGCEQNSYPEGVKA